MTSAYQRLCERFQRIDHLDHANTFLGWDQLVMMPKNGVEGRSRAMAEIANIRHELLADKELESMLADARGEVTLTEEQANLREMHRQWQRSNCLPSELVKKQIIAASKCEHAWRTQRGNSDWKGFLENFKDVLRLSREEAHLRQQADPERFKQPYDALLDLYCTGDTGELVSAVFSDLKKRLPDLINQVVAKQSNESTAPINGNFDIERQMRLNRKLMRDLGFDFDSGRLDVSMHPFSSGVKGDLRITTRFRDADFIEALQATAHETGHSSYEGGLPQQYDGQPVGAHRNMCIHESQSLLFEKQIFLSKAYIQYFTHAVNELLTTENPVDVDQLWFACTRVAPSYIRVEADEVTYPMHIMLRFDIESALINGEIEAEAIPELWDSGMQSLLGLSVGDDHNNGCLQDIHWTGGSFGYFPSYTMGAVNAAQLFNKLKRQHPDWQQRFMAGDIEFVRKWLEEKIWSKGCLLESQDLMHQATGEGSNAKHLIAHLEARYLNDAY